MNAANLLTLSRLFATPFVVWLMYCDTAGARYGALILFLAAMATDVADGLLARRGGRTVLGNYLDPIADKTLILCVFVALSHRGLLPLWMPLVLIGREFIVSGVRDVAAAQGKVIGANWMGKTKTFLQVVTIAWGLSFVARDGMPPSGGPLSYPGLYWFAFFTIVISVVFAGMFLVWNRRLLLSSGPDALDEGEVG